MALLYIVFTIYTQLISSFCYNLDKSSVLFGNLIAVRISSVEYFYIYIFYDKDCCWFTDAEDLVHVQLPSFVEGVICVHPASSWNPVVHF